MLCKNIGRVRSGATTPGATLTQPKDHRADDPRF
jgi:hypothetical protein